MEDEMLIHEANRWSPMLEEEIRISNLRGETIDRLLNQLAASDQEVDELRQALHEIAIEAENTIPPDGEEAAFAALHRILEIIIPFRRF